MVTGGGESLLYASFGHKTTDPRTQNPGWRMDTATVQTKCLDILWRHYLFTRAGDIKLSIFRCFSSASDIESTFLIESRVLCLQR